MECGHLLLVSKELRKNKIIYREKDTFGWESMNFIRKLSIYIKKILQGNDILCINMYLVFETLKKIVLNKFKYLIKIVLASYYKRTILLLCKIIRGQG